MASLMGNPPKTDSKDPLWSAELEHYELDTSNRTMVKSRSCTPWFDERDDIVDFAASCEGTIKKVYTRQGGEIKIATAQGWMKLEDVALPIDEDELNQPCDEAWSAEDLTLG